MPWMAETISKTRTTSPYRMPARTQATDPDGLNAAMIRPIPNTAAAADPLVPTCWSIGPNSDTSTLPTAPPSRPMPISSIPIRRISGLTPANVYVRHAVSHGLDSIAMSIPNEVPITPEGLEAVRREHDELTTKRRPGIVAKIKAARELGDLSENFEYHAAKNEQGMMEARINELEAIVKNHVLIESTRSNGVVAMGSTVRFQEDGESEESYRIVGPAEADPKSGRVSYESALGKALIGHRVGEQVEIKTPNGSYRVRIVGVD